MLDFNELNRAVTTADLSHLAEVEREQIRYWMPPTVGEIIFNWFD